MSLKYEPASEPQVRNIKGEEYAVVLQYDRHKRVTDTLRVHSTLTMCTAHS